MEMWFKQITRRGLLLYILQVACFTVVYFLAGKLGFRFAFVQNYVSLIWPPAGIAIAVMVLSKGRLWPGIFIGEFLLSAASGMPLAIALIPSLGNTLEGLAGAYLLIRVADFHPSLDRVRDVLALVSFSMVLSTGISAGFGVLALLFEGLIAVTDVIQVWGVWWVGNAIGILVFAPLLLTWGNYRHIKRIRKHIVEASLVVFSTALLSWVVFNIRSNDGNNYPLAFITVPLLIWMALRFGQRGTTTIAFIISSTAVIALARTDRPLSDMDTYERLLFLAGFVLVSSLTSMLLAATLTGYRRVELELEQERDFALRVMNALAQGVTVTNDEGNFEFVNPAYEKIMGYPKEAILGKSPLDFTHPDDLVMLKRARADRREGKTSSYELRMQRGDGEFAHVMISGSPRWQDGTVKGTIAVTTDLTKRKRIEDALRESEARFQTAVNNLPFDFWSMDAEGRYVLQSPNSMQRWGRFVGKTLDELDISPQAAARWRRSNERILAGETLTGEVDYMVNGEKRSFYYISSPIRAADSDAILGILGVDVDITDRKRAEEALKRSEETNLEFLERLKALHEISAELAKLETVDDMCRKAVETGRSRLKFDRMSIWFTDEDPAYMVGSFGVDENGNIRDERQQRIEFNSSWYPTTSLSNANSTIYFRENTELLDDRRGKVGKGWVAMAMMQDGNRLLGALSVDNLVTQKPAERYELEILALFGDTIGNLYVRKRAEEALRQSESRYRNMVELSPDGIFLTSNRKFNFVNPAFLKIMGATSPAELLGKTVMDFIHPDYHNMVEERVDQMSVRDARVPFIYEQYLRMDGSAIDVEVAAITEKDQSHQVFVRDIAERKRAERAIQESEARFRSIFEGATLGISVVNREGYPRVVNQAFEKMLGYTADEFRQMTFTDYTHPDDVALDIGFYQQLVRHEINHYELEKRYVRKNGETFWVKIHVSLFPGGTEEGEFIMALIEDIHKRKRAEEALQKLTADLEYRVTERTAELAAANVRLTELDRLKTKLIADVSHELRTPLTVMNTRVYLIQHSKAEKHADYLNSLKLQIDRMAHFVNNSLDLSRLELSKENIAFESVNFNEVVEQVVNALQPRAEFAGLGITFAPENTLPPVKGEAHRLSQIVTNLVANAINYTSEGAVSVQTLRDAEREMVCLRVQDTGMGIHADEIPHLFERFYRGERAGQTNIPGSGLGLSIVKELLDLHNGDIQVESEPGSGTTFRVWLPVYQ